MQPITNHYDTSNSVLVSVITFILFLYCLWWVLELTSKPHRSVPGVNIPSILSTHFRKKLHWDIYRTLLYFQVSGSFFKVKISTLSISEMFSKSMGFLSGIFSSSTEKPLDKTQSKHKCEKRCVLFVSVTSGNEIKENFKEHSSLVSLTISAQLRFVYTALAVLTASFSG